ncbi:spermidine synthase [Elaphomyces granulatus]
MCGHVNQILHHENSDYGTVLALDNVIQLYGKGRVFEMITHLAMNSHPNPKKVLVIGEDGGAILCDTDEVDLFSVIRVSKKYLPSMSIEFQHPGMKLTDSEGPAESLFQRPFFELRSKTNALISKLKQSCQEVFPVVEYAYTTISTYPSAKSASARRNRFVRGLKKKSVYVGTTIKEIHRASFVLPNFARKVLL